MLRPHHDKNYVHLPAPGLVHCPQTTAAMNNNSPTSISLCDWPLATLRFHALDTAIRMFVQ